MVRVSRSGVFTAVASFLDCVCALTILAAIARGEAMERVGATGAIETAGAGSKTTALLRTGNEPVKEGVIVCPTDNAEVPKAAIPNFPTVGTTLAFVAVLPKTFATARVAKGPGAVIMSELTIRVHRDFLMVRYCIKCHSLDCRS